LWLCGRLSTILHILKEVECPFLCQTLVQQLIYHFRWQIDRDTIGSRSNVCVCEYVSDRIGWLSLCLSILRWWLRCGERVSLYRCRDSRGRWVGKVGSKRIGRVRRHRSWTVVRGISFPQDEVESMVAIVVDLEMSR
jgi:hypothetical protein